MVIKTEGKRRGEKRHPNVKPTAPSIRKPIMLLLVMLVFSICFQHNVFAFKQKYHEVITKAALLRMGFDVDSADKIAFANSNTDYWEVLSDAAHADANQLHLASARLREKIEEIFEALQACNRYRALNELGKALHTVQDVYAHSNTVDNGIPIKNILYMAEGTATCNDNGEFAPGGLVSGYFSKFGFLLGEEDQQDEWFDQCFLKPEEMCCHKYLAKDEPGCLNSDNYLPAVSAATEGTKDYLKKLEEHMAKETSSEMAVYYMNMLKKKLATVVFVIDTTGSMMDDIASVKARINWFLDRLGTINEAPRLGLVTFKDSAWNRGIYCDIEAFRAKINSLSASGGGDCPEASNRALLTAMYHFSLMPSEVMQGSRHIVLMTDASARNPGLGPRVQQQAKARGVRIHSFVTSDCKGMMRRDNQGGTTCSPTATTYYAATEDDPLTSDSSRIQLNALANETGGVMYWIERSEVEDVTDKFIEMADVNSAIIVQRRINGIFGETVEVEIPVDDTLDEKVTFMVTQSPSGTLSSLQLIRPNGDTAKAGDTDVDYMELSSVRTYTVSQPEIGIWKMRVQGKGEIMARLYGNTDLHINGARFFTPLSTPHPRVDFIPVEGDPVAGRNVHLDMCLSQTPGEVEVTLRRQNGDWIKELVPEEIDETGCFQMQLEVPEDDFMIEMTGQTTDGNRFSRVVPFPVQSRRVSISVSPKIATVPIGGTAGVALKIYNNTDKTAEYKITMSTSLDWPEISIPEFQVEGKGTREINLDIPVPENVEEGAVNDIAFLVQDVEQAENRNSVSMTLTAAGEDSTPPEVSIITPGQNSYTNDECVDIIAKVKDDSSVLVTCGEESKVVPAGGEYYVSLKGLPLNFGLNRLVITARDSGNNYGDVVLEIHRGTPPTVKITNPLEDGVVSGIVTIEVEAEDDDGIRTVDFYINKELKHTVREKPYIFKWDTRLYPNGRNVIKVKACDKAGFVSKDRVPVTVQNSSKRNGGKK